MALTSHPGSDTTAVASPSRTETVQSYCGLCAVHCPALIGVEERGVVTLQPDPSHPFGGLLCAKGRAAPELHDHAERVNYPLRRTRPKTDPDPGWERCTWDEALDLIAHKLLDVRATSGPQAVVLAKGTSGGTGLNEVEPWIGRLANCFGTPNLISTTHLCQWPRDTGAGYYTFGTDRLAVPDVANSGCVVLWGTNPSGSFLGLGHDVAVARSRGAKLLVIDPRRVGLANKAHLHLRPRPGTDGALALSLIHVLIEEQRFDEPFVRHWTNAPLLVRDDTGQLLRAGDLGESPSAARPGYVALRQGGKAVVAYDPALGVYEGGAAGLLLRGSQLLKLADSQEIGCQPVFERLAAQAALYAPPTAERITGVPAGQIVVAARLLAEHRPVSHYFHNGLVQHTNATQASRAIGVLYALLGDFDRRGGNVVSPSLLLNPVEARSALPGEMEACRLGRAERPLGPPSRPGNITPYDVYEAILEAQPYPVRALLAFGHNILLATGDTLRGREALQRLEFFAQVELFHTPTSAFADVLLPAADFLETSALHHGFRYPVEALVHLQRRQVAVEPLYERRGDMAVLFDLACRLGLGDHFWGGSVEAGNNYMLEPSGFTWESLGKERHGVMAPSASLSYEKYAQIDARTGSPLGFATPTRKVELFSTAFAAGGAPPLPVYVEPALSPLSTPAIAAQFPLVMTNAKRPVFLHSQMRGLPSLRKAAPNPTAELHPETAAPLGIADGEWVVVETPSGSARAQARVTSSILPGVVCLSHGWWQGCEALGLPALDPFTSAGANINLLVPNDRHDPVSGGTPHRSYLCRLSKP